VPIRSSIDVGQRLVTSVAEGVLDLTLLIEHSESLKADPRFDPSFDQIADFSGVTDIRLSPDDVRHLAAHSIFSAQSRRVAIAPSDLTFGMGRMFQSYIRLFGGAEHACIFRNRSEALEWLLGKAS
jgi:hypothetical protein